MPKGEFLGEFEQLVLLALLRVGEGGVRHGDSPRDSGARRTRCLDWRGVRDARSHSRKKASSSRASANRRISVADGPKKCFTMTGAGARALERSQQAVRQMLEGLPARWNPAR